MNEGHTPNYLDLPLGGFLDRTASSDPAPGGGAAAAITVSLAAALASMAARLSAEQLTEADALIERADRLREETPRLAGADAEAYGKVITAQRAGSGVRAALSGAADVPLSVAEAGAEVVDIASRLTEDGNPSLRGDAITAVILAGAGVRAAASLVEINLSAAGVTVADGRLDRARQLSDNAAKAGT